MFANNTVIKVKQNIEVFVLIFFVGKPYFQSQSNSTRHFISLFGHKGPFIFYEGGGLVGFGKQHFKNRMTPPQLANFFTWSPLMAVIFLDDPPLTTHKKKSLPQDFTFLIFSIIPLLDVIVLTMKTKLTIPILQRALRSKRTQIKRKRGQTLLFLGHRSLIKNKKQIAVINILNLRIF